MTSSFLAAVATAPSPPVVDSARGFLGSPLCACRRRPALPLRPDRRDARARVRRGRPARRRPRAAATRSASFARGRRQQHPFIEIWDGAKSSTTPWDIPGRDGIWLTGLHAVAVRDAPGLAGSARPRRRPRQPGPLPRPARRGLKLIGEWKFVETQIELNANTTNGPNVNLQHAEATAPLPPGSDEGSRSSRRRSASSTRPSATSSPSRRGRDRSWSGRRRRAPSGRGSRTSGSASPAGSASSAGRSPR